MSGQDKIVKLGAFIYLFIYFPFFSFLFPLKTQ